MTAKFELFKDAAGRVVSPEGPRLTARLSRRARATHPGLRPRTWIASIKGNVATGSH